LLHKQNYKHHRKTCKIHYFQGFELDISSKRIFFSSPLSRLVWHFQSCL